MVRMNTPTHIGELFQSSKGIRGCTDFYTRTTTPADDVFVPPYQPFLLLDIILDYGEEAAVILQWKESTFYAVVEYKYIYRPAEPKLL